MPEPSELLDLLRQARSGDESARDELFAKCRTYIGVVARAQVESWIQSKVDASDLVQQTMLEAYQGFDNFRGTSEQEWLAWLRRILQHNATDFIRQYGCTEKRQAKRERPLAGPVDDSLQRAIFEPNDPGLSPSKLVMQHEREIEVAEAVSQLPDDYQEVIMLRNLQRLPFDDVADRMGRSRPAVQMLWMRALRKLEEVLSG